MTLNEAKKILNRAGYICESKNAEDVVFISEIRPKDNYIELFFKKYTFTKFTEDDRDFINDIYTRILNAQFIKYAMLDDIITDVMNDTHDNGDGTITPKIKILFDQSVDDTEDMMKFGRKIISLINKGY